MERALTASSFSTPIDACLDHHPVANHHRDVAVPQIRPVSRRRPEAIAALVLLMPSTPIGVFAGRVSRFALFRVVQPSVFAGHSSFCSGFDSQQLHKLLLVRGWKIGLEAPVSTCVYLVGAYRA